MATTPNYSQPAIFSEVSTPVAPDAGYLKVYGKSGALCSIANGGSEKTYATSLDLSAYLPLAGGTLTGDLLFTDATYDIGKSGATRPRDGFFSRNLTVGSQLSVPYGDSTNPSILIGNTNTGIHGLNDGSRRIRFTVGGTLTAEYAAGAHIIDGSLFFGVLGSSPKAGLISSQSDVLEVRNSNANTTAQTLELNNTWTSTTSFEKLRIKANAGAAYQIGSAKGSAGGNNQAVAIGHWDAAGAFASWLTVSTVGTVTTGGNFVIGGNQLTFNTDTAIRRTSAGMFEINNGTPGTRRDLTLRNLTSNSVTIAQEVSTSGSPTAFTITGAAHTTLAASTEATDVNVNLARTVQFANGAITTQRAFRIQAPVYAHVSGSNTITTASTVSISGPPTTTGGFTTITNAYALNVESGKIRAVGGLVVGATDGFNSSLDIGNGLVQAWASGYSCLVMNFGGNPLSYHANWGLGGIQLQDRSAGFGWSSLSNNLTNFDAAFYSPAANIIEQRRTTNAQSFRVYTTYTSSSSLELLQMRGVASSSFEIGTMKGSAGGSARGLTIGCYANESATITPWLSFTSSGVATVNTGTLVINSGGTGLMTKQTNIWLDSYGTHSGISYRRSEGTEASPTAVASNSLLGFFATYGYHSGAAYHSTQGCAISFYATEAYTATAQGAKMLLGTTPNGTTTLATVLTLEDSGVSHFSKLVGQTATEITSTPSGTTQTITLNNGNHQTLALTSSTGDVTVTLTVPSKVASGTLIIKQHASTPRDITWAVSSGSIVWLGAEPAWSSDATNDVRIVSWRYNGSVMYLVATDVGA